MKVNIGLHRKNSTIQTTEEIMTPESFCLISVGSDWGTEEDIKKACSLIHPLGHNCEAIRAERTRRGSIIVHLKGEHLIKITEDATPEQKRSIYLDKPLVFFDIETTGLSLTEDAIVEISMIKIFPDKTKLS